MAAARPDPDALLARVQREEEKARRGKLKIFFGATAGVGKTYAMLEEARRQKAKGGDVVVGYVEPHGRAETEALLEGLEQLPYRTVTYRGAALRDFDLDAALARKPALLLVDELAHTNPIEGQPPPRHGKRWQDIEELRDAGIDVYTTVNVQHIESLNDIVAGITGVRMRETVPDVVFETADEVELVDTPPDELLERLRAGKVYVPEQARQALESFFRKGNLIALRELALRTTADRVDAAMREYKEGHAIRETWAAGERILVAIGPYEEAERLVRAGKRLATALHAEWIVVYVETPDLLRLPEAERDRRIELLRKAESLGAEAVTLGGSSAGEEIANYARTRNVTRILIGRPRRALWRRLLRPSTYGELLANTEGIDVHVVGGADEAAALRSPFLARTRAYLQAARPESAKVRWPGYAWAVIATALCTVVGAVTAPLFELANIVMVYLLAVVLIAVRHGRGPAITASVLGVASFDFFFVPPQFTFAVSDAQYLITFAIMLAVALVISNLAASVRLQARVAGHRERRTALLYAMSRELAATRGQEAMARAAVRHVSEVFESQAVVLLPDAGRLRYPRGDSIAGSLHGADLSIAQWVQDHGHAAGLGTDTLPGAEALYLPLHGGPAPPEGARPVLGVLAVLPANPRRVTLPEQYHLLETFAAQIALALERAEFAERAQRASIDAETEGLRNALLASISHDLRTPLAVISGASSSLAEGGERMSPAERAGLARSVFEQSQQMAQLVANVLEMTRLEAGAIALERDWHSLAEIAGAVLRRLTGPLASHAVEVHLPPDLPLVRVDATLLEQVFANLLQNAAKYTPPGTHVVLRAERADGRLRVSIEDDGPGLPPGDPEQLFAKFERGAREGAIGGVGLGLAICRAIVRLHGGRIWAERLPGAGAAFRFTLPLETPPEAPPEP